MQQQLSQKRFFTVVAACLSVLAASTAQALFVSEKEIIRQARVDWMTMKRDLPKPANPRIQPFVECISRSIIDVLEEPYASMDWEVVVFDDEAVNAFAMVGGQIGIFTGIFRVADTPDMLAAVIGHEIAHVTERHVMARARRQAGGDVLSILGGAAAGRYGRGAADTVSTFGILLPFSRKQETESDLVGLEYMAKAGYDPRTSIQLWKNMSANREGQEVAEFASTHPADDRRMRDLVSSMTPALIAYNQALAEGRKSTCSPTVDPQ